ncbi:HAMP domain-containing protein [Baekduia soli]|uniref:histidine kinase n=1 Tax=Baekduia soli TaxID=496014 RepID=A0A5B8UCI9_9ACTN|nr:HAMP domain-containing sensor histidine kinase [Baekduia soli]QEC50381.1 HAMP domain-containing protein [Baekduia soli]
MSAPAGLRPRITLLICGVVALCLLVGFLAVYRGTATTLQGRTDRGLRDDLADLQRSAHGPSAAQRAEQAQTYLARQPYRATTHVAFVVIPGRVPVTNEPELLVTTGRDADDTPAERRQETIDARAVLGAPAGFSRRVLPGVGPVRLLVAVQPTGEGQVRFGVAEPVEPVERAESTVSRAFLLAGALGMAAALLGGLLVASRVAAPLRRMARVAARVEAGDLGPRMGLSGRRDEVQVLAHAFDQMLDRLEAAFARQGAFIADASHELRTPLTIVRGQLEVLAMNDHPSAEEVRRVKDMVSVEIDRMSRLVEDLVVLSHAPDEGFLRLEHIDLPGFLTGICDGLRPTADRVLELTPVPPLVMEADPDRLAQSLRNLLRNAIVHTEPGGLVRLGVREHGDRIWFLVDDDGPGVPVADRARVFDRFARLDAARGRDRGGAGLGLSIVQAIAQAHGGEAWVARSPEGGARFVLDLPRTAAPEPAPARPAPSSPATA